MKRISGIILVCALLTGCSAAHNTVLASKPNSQLPTYETTSTASNQIVNTTSNSLPTPPAGLDWYEVTVNHKTYEYPAKTQQDTQYVGLLADTKYGVAWSNPTHPAQILLSPPGTTVLAPAKAKVIYIFTLPKDKDASLYSCAAEYFDTSPDAPDYLFWGAHVFKTADRWVGTEDIHALNLKTGKDQVIIRHVTTGGGYNWWVCYHSHYVFYKKETPTISDYKDIVGVVDLNTGYDKLIWTGENDKMPTLKVSLDDGIFTPVWTGYGAIFG